MVERSFWQKTKWKLVVSVALSLIIWTVSGLIGFPRLFQWMFMGYVIGGLLFFILLDARPMKERSGGAAVLSVIVFYLIVSFVYTINGALWPQYNPAEEKEKIAKLMKSVVSPKQKIGELEAKVEELSKKVEELSTRPAAPAAAPAPSGEAAKKAAGKVAGIPAKAGPSPELIAQGKEVYDLYECYNCHKIGGKGGVKRRGPELDHAGKEFTAEQLKKRIWYPYAPGTKATEGFEKEFEEQTMPDYYNEQISKEEMAALVAYVLSLK